MCTRGDQGGAPDEDMSLMTARREEEQRAASAELGVTDVRFLDGYRDGWLEPSHSLQRDIVRVIRQVRPDRILTQSPERNWDRLFASHPDHLAVGEATIRAVYPASENPHAWPELVTEEGLAPYKVPEVWLMGHHTQTVTVDITDVFEKKVAALTRQFDAGDAGAGTWLRADPAHVAPDLHGARLLAHGAALGMGQDDVDALLPA